MPNWISGTEDAPPLNAASSSQEEGWLTLSQIGDKIGIDKDSFETLDEYFAEIKKEVDDNHKKHGIEKRPWC